MAATPFRLCLLASVLFVAFVSFSWGTEIEEFEVLNNENNPVRKEFDTHTATCFKLFKSSMLKLTALFLDPESDTMDKQRESKCWIRCVLEQFKFLSVLTSNETNVETGEILTSRIMEKTSVLSPGTRSKLSQILEKCDEYSRSIDDVCNKAFGFAKCIFEMYRSKDYMSVIPTLPVFTPAILMSSQGTPQPAAPVVVG